MTEKLKEVIKREIEKLPKDTQEVVNIVDWVGIIEQIGKKYLLSESEINDFQVQTFLVLIGLRDVELYEINIENDVGTTKDKAQKMADEVYKQIFEPIGNIIEENIKKNLKNKNIRPEDNINFILSGGNYSVFVDDKNKLSN